MCNYVITMHCLIIKLCDIVKPDLPSQVSPFFLHSPFNPNNLSPNKMKSRRIEYPECEKNRRNGEYKFG